MGEMDVEAVEIEMTKKPQMEPGSEQKYSFPVVAAFAPVHQLYNSARFLLKEMQRASSAEGFKIPEEVYDAAIELRNAVWEMEQ